LQNRVGELQRGDLVGAVGPALAGFGQSPGDQQIAVRRIVAVGDMGRRIGVPFRV
jgi:hypothetical protein